jgi:hypothetical protein
MHGNGYRRPGPPRGGPGPYVWKPDPKGACAPAPDGAPRTSLPTGEEVRHAPRAPEEVAAFPALPHVQWQPAFCGKLAQLPH